MNHSKDNLVQDARVQNNDFLRSSPIGVRLESDKTPASTKVDFAQDIKNVGNSKVTS